MASLLLRAWQKAVHLSRRLHERRLPEFAPTIVFSNGGRNVARRVQAAGLNKMTKFIRGSGR